MKSRHVGKHEKSGDSVEIDPGQIIDLLPENELFRPVKRFGENFFGKDDSRESDEDHGPIRGIPRMW